MVEAVTEPDLGKQGAGAREPGTARDTRVDHRQLHILQRGGARQQIEGLEHESDAAIADRRKVIVVERVHLDALETIRAAGCPIEAAEMFMKVDFPEPDGPMTARNSPRAMSAEMPVSARTAP